MGVRPLRASIGDAAREVERLWILWTLWKIAPAADGPAPKKSKKRADGRGCGSRVRRLSGGNGLRLPFLCVRVIGRFGREVETHPSEPFE